MRGLGPVRAKSRTRLGDTSSEEITPGTIDMTHDLNLTGEERTALHQALELELRKPPTIGLGGVSGVGKSSTLNTLFRTHLPVSHTTACTREFTSRELTLAQLRGEAKGLTTQLIVYDAPGLGEDARKDAAYLEMYRETLPRCDVILWVLTARNRAVALDQLYLAQFPDLHSRMVFGLSQVDLVEPMNWKPNLPIPSREQEFHIAEIVRDRSERLTAYLGRPVKAIPYSDQRGYNLEELFTALMTHCTKGRAWLFAGLKNFSYKDFLPLRAADRSQAPARSSQVLFPCPNTCRSPVISWRGIALGHVAAGPAYLAKVHGPSATS